jgi:hypothetical protein
MKSLGARRRSSVAATSGVLLTYQLLHNPGADFRAMLVELWPDIGLGLANHAGNSSTCLMFGWPI